MVIPEPCQNKISILNAIPIPNFLIPSFAHAKTEHGGTGT